MTYTARGKVDNSPEDLVKSYRKVRKREKEIWYMIRVAFHICEWKIRVRTIDGPPGKKSSCVRNSLHTLK